MRLGARKGAAAHLSMTCINGFREKNKASSDCFFLKCLPVSATKTA